MALLEIYDSIYFRLNKQLLQIIGLWPYDSRRKVVRVLWIALVLVLHIPHVAGMILHISDMDKVMEHFSASTVLTAVFLKHSTQVTAERQMKAVYNDIAKNWSMIVIDDKEKKILLKYSQRGRLITIVYTAGFMLVMLSMVILPLIPEILNRIDPLPVPRPRINILNGEFFLENRDDHYWKIYLWDTTTIVVVGVMLMAIDSMYSASVDHATALFAIVTHRLSELRNRDVISESKDARTVTSYDWLVHTIKLHQVVLRFTNNINDSYSLCFFCLSIMNCVAIPMICVVILIFWHNLVDVIRYGFVLSGLMMHLFVLFWPGQRLIDHSSKLVDNAYCNDWYETSAATKKLLEIFMLQCSQPCSITAGGLVEMNFEVYSKVVKTAVSYVTVFASFR